MVERKGVGDAVERMSALSGELPLAAEVVTQVAGFASWLRSHAFLAAVPETKTALAALTHVDLADEGEVMQALRAVYAKTPAQWGMFEGLFRRHFLEQGRRLQEKRRVDAVGTGRTTGAGRNDEERMKVAAMSPIPGSSRSTGERYAVRVDGDVLKAVCQETVRAMASLPAPPGRRFEPGLYGHIDLRRTAQSAMRTCGLVQHWHRRRLALDRPRVMLLMDVSGSMKPHASFLTTIAWSFLRTPARVEVFVFSTRLLRVTALLRRRGVVGLAERDFAAAGLAGGTRIGDCLWDLMNRQTGLINRHTVLIVASDGFDAGQPERLHSAFETLRQRVRRIVWLNPLLGDPEYDPTVSAMRIALPYLDAFVDVHDAPSWQAVVQAGVLARSTITLQNVRFDSLRPPG